METKKKKSIKHKAQKAVVTQDNRLIYAKYDMNANELKFFMWIVAQINSQKEQLFQVCEMPLSEIFEVWQWKETSEGYKYVRDLCKSMLQKTYIEDFKLLDEKTMKEINIFKGYTLFKFIEYKEGQGHITYQLNDSLMQYLLDLKRDFTQLKFSDIQQMKSAYSIRIYNMLICELKQNRQKLKINLSALQNILEVPKSLEIWDNFKQKVLAQAKKDINMKSNIVLLDINTYKTGRKITDLEFVFDYKNNDKRIAREQEKKQKYNLALIEAIEKLLGKTMFFKDYGNLTLETWQWVDENKDKLAAIFRNQSKGDTIGFFVKDFKTIETLHKAKDKAEELFYLDTENVKKAKEFAKTLELRGLFAK